MIPLQQRFYQEAEVFALALEFDTNVSEYHQQLGAWLTSIVSETGITATLDELDDHVDGTDVEHYYQFKHVVIDVEIEHNKFSTTQASKDENSMAIFMNQCPSKTSIEYLTQKLDDFPYRRLSLYNLPTETKLLSMKIVSIKETEFFQNYEELILETVVIDEDAIRPGHFKRIATCKTERLFYNQNK